LRGGVGGFRTHVQTLIQIKSTNKLAVLEGFEPSFLMRDSQNSLPMGLIAPIVYPNSEHGCLTTTTCVFRGYWFNTRLLLTLFQQVSSRLSHQVMTPEL